MGFLNRKPKLEEPIMEGFEETAPPYIDLADRVGKGKQVRRGMEVKVAELQGYEDLRQLSNFIYDGNILVLDFSAIANDELSLKRIVTELKRLVADVGGDLAGIGQHLLIITPKSVKIDRHKMRRGFY
jgi:SepF-like predicted cell division protein (DUF552 family)